MQQGKLIVWKDDRGFGFIEPDQGGRRVFLHISALKDANRRPQVGDVIHYQLFLSKNGKVRATTAFIKGATARAVPEVPPNIFNQPLTSQRSSEPPQSWILETLLLSLLPLAGSLNFAWTMANPIPLIVYLFMSFLTFALYADDKFRAKKHQRRVPESRLHLCELLGGWLGAFVAQRRLRHKNRKAAYQRVFWSIVALHMMAWIGWFLLGRKFINFSFN